MNLKKRKLNKKAIFGVILLLVAIVVGVIVATSKPGELKKALKKKFQKVEEPKLQIYDLSSKNRPIAVMINNHNNARPYHSGLQNAQVVYEIIVEGGITRMMAVFKDQDISRIGPVRSSRHYYLDYAMENDAIYVHWGWSPQAESDISSYSINNLNGLYDPGFARDQDLVGRIDLEHTAITSTAGINEAIAKKGYRTEYEGKVEDSLPFKYSVKEINLKPEEKKIKKDSKKSSKKKDTQTDTEPQEPQSDAIVANNISIPYSYYMTASYTYVPEKKYYLRSANGEAHTDYVTKEQYHFKNIIVLKMRNFTFDDYGRQDIDDVGSGTGYFITNGYARPITWEKSSRGAKTIYKYANGEEVVLNDGNTFVQIQPIDEETTITE